MSSAPSLVILDRDGVINEDSERYIRSVEEWHALPGSLEAIAALARAGFRIAVATNQSGVGRGLVSEQTLQRIHAHMIEAIEAAGGALAGVYYCPHRPQDGCTCRKPKPGLLERIGRELGYRLANVPVIGDKLTDVHAAQAVGARPILVRSGYADAAAARRADAAVEVYPDLAGAARALIAERG